MNVMNTWYLEAFLHYVTIVAFRFNLLTYLLTYLLDGRMLSVVNFLNIWWSYGVCFIIKIKIVFHPGYLLLLIFSYEDNPEKLADKETEKSEEESKTSSSDAKKQK